MKAVATPPSLNMGKAELKIDADLLAQAQAAGVRADQVAESALRIALCACVSVSE